MLGQFIIKNSVENCAITCRSSKLTSTKRTRVNQTM